MAVKAQIGTVFVVNWSFEQWMRVSGLLESYAAMMALGLVLGLVTGGFPAYTKEGSMASCVGLLHRPVHHRARWRDREVPVLHSGELPRGSCPDADSHMAVDRL